MVFDETPVRVKKSGERAYVHIVENKRVDGAVRQSVIATLGRGDARTASGALASKLTPGAKLADWSFSSTRSTRTPKNRCWSPPNGSVARCCLASYGSGSALARFSAIS